MDIYQLEKEVERCQDQVRELSNNVKDSPEFEKICLENLKEKNKPVVMDFGSLKQKAGIPNLQQDIIGKLIYGFLWPLDLRNPDCFVWSYTKFKPNLMDRTIASIIFAFFYYSFLFRVFKKLLSSVFSTNPIFEKTREVEIEKNTRKNTHKNIRNSWIERFRSDGNFIERGGHQNPPRTQIYQTNLLDPIFGIVLFYRVIYNYEFEIDSKLDIVEPIQSSKFNILRKIKERLKRVFLSEYTIGLLGFAFWIMVQLAAGDRKLSVGRTQSSSDSVSFYHQQLQLQNKKQAVEIVQPANKIEIGEGVGDKIVTGKTVKKSDVSTLEKRNKTEERKIKKKIPLSQRTQTLEGLKLGEKTPENVETEADIEAVSTIRRETRIRVRNQ